MDNNVFKPVLVLPSEQPSNDTSIGRILMDMGKITSEDTQRILRLQKDKGLRFGAAALQLGLITEEDINQVLSKQFSYPYLQNYNVDFNPILVAAYQPFSKEVEALRILRSQLLLHWFGEGKKALTIVGAKAGEGCSRMAANLAVVFSQLGKSTLLVDANLRAPDQHNIFKIKESLGLSDILAGRANLEVIVSVESLAGLSVLGAGTIPPNPQELLSRISFAGFMHHVTNNYDVVILDTPPAMESSDAQTATLHCGGAMLVSILNETRIDELANVKEQIVISGASVVCAVINNF